MTDTTPAPLPMKRGQIEHQNEPIIRQKSKTIRQKSKTKSKIRPKRLFTIQNTVVYNYTWHQTRYSGSRKLLKITNILKVFITCMPTVSYHDSMTTPLLP